jgi:hypothetical protein
LSREIPADSELGQKFLDFRLSLVKKSFLEKGTKKEIFLLAGSIKLCGAQQTIKFIEFLNVFHESRSSGGEASAKFSFL